MLVDGLRMHICRRENEFRPRSTAAQEIVALQIQVQRMEAQFAQALAAKQDAADSTIAALQRTVLAIVLLGRC